MQDFDGETRVSVDRYEFYGENPKIGKMVISLLADVSVVECRHTPTHAHCIQLHILICSSGQEPTVRSLAVSRLLPPG